VPPFLTSAGPFSLPLIGDLPWIVMYGMHEYAWRCQQKYGKIFKVSIVEHSTGDVSHQCLAPFS